MKATNPMAIIPNANTIPPMKLVNDHCWRFGSGAGFGVVGVTVDVLGATVVVVASVDVVVFSVVVVGVSVVL